MAEELLFKTKWYTDLSRDELYDILQLRSEVFVVEQDCVYQDIDGKDAKALHILGYLQKELVGYTRIFKGGDYFKEVGIGRVVVKDTQRKSGYGYVLMEASIQAVNKELGEQAIKVSAQTYLIDFYNSLGFNAIDAEYLEDGIPHIGMIKRQ